MEEAGGSGIELEERIPGAPNRQQSLESQRQAQPLPWILRRLLGGSSVVSRPSGPVDDAIEAGAKACRSDARSFLRDFYHMSHRQKARVQEIFDIFIRLRRMGTESDETTGISYYHVCLPLATDHCSSRTRETKASRRL